MQFQVPILSWYSVVTSVDEVDNASTQSRVGRVGQIANTTSEVADVVDTSLIGQRVGGGEGDGLGRQGRVELVQETKGDGILEASTEVLEIQLMNTV